MGDQWLITGGCGILMAIFSFVFYAITMGVGWALNQNVYPGNSLILGGAVVSTIPVFAVMAYAVVACMCNKDQCDAVQGIAACALLIQSVATIFEVIGGILFIAAGATLKDKNSDVFAYGVSAGVFGILAGITCCCAQVCIVGACRSDSSSKSSEVADGE